jgi:hypothetical protein
MNDDARNHEREDELCCTFRWGAEEQHEKSYVTIYNFLGEIRNSVLPTSALESYMSLKAICSRMQL